MFGYFAISTNQNLTHYLVANDKLFIPNTMTFLKHVRDNGIKSIGL